MRDILNKLNHVASMVESKGITNRKPGDLFHGTEEQGDIAFISAKVFPEGGGSVEPADLPDLIATAEADGPIIWVNPESMKGSGAFIVASFNKEDNHIEGPGVIRFGRFMKQVFGHLHQNQQWKNVIPGYRFGGKGSVKMLAGIMPQDILTKLDDLTPDDIVAQIEEKFGDTHPLTGLANDVASGTPLPIKFAALTDVPFAAFRDYFCELLQPIALMRRTTTGSAHEAEELYLPDDGYASCTISFGDSKTEGLSDSIMTAPSGSTIKVSSKGAGGATASVKNLAQAISKINSHGGSAQAKLLTKHASALTLIQTIANRPAKFAPVDLAVELGLISNEERMAVFRFEDMEKNGVINFATVLNHPLMTAKLKKLYFIRKPKVEEKSSAFIHMVSVIAYAVAEEVNSSPEFSAAASALLNNEALVQVYTIAKEVNEYTWELSKFVSVFPGSAVTSVLLDPGKSYSSTKINGKFTFEIYHNNANPKPINVAPEEPEPVASTVPDPVRAPGSTSDLKAADSEKPAAVPAAAYGRKKR